MRQAFEAVAKTYDTVKKSVQEKMQVFKEKFMGSKEAAIKEIGNSHNSEEYVAALEKALAEAKSLQSEEKEVDAAEGEVKDIEAKSEGYEEASQMNKEFDENKAAEKAAAESAAAEQAAEEARLAEEERLEYEQEVKANETADAEKYAELLSKLNEVGETEKISDEKAEEIPSPIKNEAVVVEKVEQREKSPEEKMDDYIEKFKKIGGEHGTYSLIFQTMRDDKDIDFLNNDTMIVKFVKEMGTGSMSYLDSYCSDKKVFSKGLILEIINSLPAKEDSSLGKGGYGVVMNFADKAKLGNDPDVVEAVIRKNKFMAYDIFGQTGEQNRRAAQKIIDEGPDAYFNA